MKGPTANSPLHRLMEAFPQAGTVRWLGVRPERGAAMLTPTTVEARAGHGLTGDRYQGSSGKRDVTLIQWEHLPVVASLLGINELDPAVVRRNIAVSGINLLALRDRRFRIGDAVLEGTGLCHPCSKMEALLGIGGYNALRGHGGITARVLQGGLIRVHDSVQFLAAGE